MLVAMSGVSMEQVTRALDESGGNVDQAMVRLNSDKVSGDTIAYRVKSTRFRRHEAEEDFDDSIAISPNPRPSSGYEQHDGKQYNIMTEIE
jgi:hypothetical protein